MQTLISHDLAAFQAWIASPERAQQDWEWINGEIVEVVSSGRSSVLGMKIGTFINLHVMRFKLGVVSGADVGYVVGGERYIPDVAFTRAERATEELIDAYFAYAPDLVVEVLSPTDRLDRLRHKIARYLEAGTVVWVLDPQQQTAEVYEPGQPARLLQGTDSLEGSGVLAGLNIPLAELW